MYNKNMINILIDQNKKSTWFYLRDVCISALNLMNTGKKLY